MSIADVMGPLTMVDGVGTEHPVIELRERGTHFSFRKQQSEYMSEVPLCNATAYLNALCAKNAQRTGRTRLTRDFSVGICVLSTMILSCTFSKASVLFPFSSPTSYIDASPIVRTLNGLHDLYCKTKAPPRDFFNLYPRSLPPPPENGDQTFRQGRANHRTRRGCNTESLAQLGAHRGCAPNGLRQPRAR